MFLLVMLPLLCVISIVIISKMVISIIIRLSQCQQEGSLKPQVFIRIKSKTNRESEISCKHFKKIRGNWVKGPASGILAKLIVVTPTAHFKCKSPFHPNQIFSHKA